MAQKFGLTEDEINEDEICDITLEIQIFYHLQLLVN